MMSQLPQSPFGNPLRFLLILLTLTIGISGVRAQCPVNASFNHSSSYICQGASLTFNNTTTGGAIGQNWFENVTSFSTLLSPTRTFNTPGTYIISLLSTNGACTDTAQSAITVSPTMTATATFVSPTCFNGTNGSANLTPGGGTPNRSVNNNRAISDYIAANTVSNAGYAGGITVEAWVKPRSTWTTGDGLFMAFNQTGGTSNRFFVGYNPGFQQFVYFDDNTGNSFMLGTQPRGNWYHVALTINAANQVNFYLNGVLNKTFNTTNTWIPQAGDRFSMGQEWDYTVLSQHFDGFIDEARVWNAVLSGPTILSNRNSCMGINNTHPNWGNLVAYYSMNEGSGTYIFDRSGRNNHGQRINGTVYGTAAESNWGCFSAGTGYGYSWSNGATTEDLTGIGAGTYTVTLMDGAGAGCNPTATVTLINPAATVVAITPPGPVAICAGLSTTLTASGANTYVWSPGTGLSGTTTPSVTASPTGTTTYTCVGTSALGCTGSSTVQVVVNPLPTATITGTNILCFGDTTTLTAGGGTSYVWSNGPTTAGNTVTPGTTTTYTVTVTDANTCIDTETATVTVNPLPIVTFTGIDTICNGDSTTITAAGGTGYVWSNGPTTAGQILAPNTSTSYTVTVSDANSCENTGSITVVVNALPVLNFAGIDTICAGDTTQITVAGASTYLWGHGPTTALVDLNPFGNTFYSVMGTDSNGCSAADSIEIIVNALPVITITGNDTLCVGDSTLLTGNGGTSYLWSTGDLTSMITAIPTGNTTYTLTGTDGNGCSGNAAFAVVVNALPTPTITGLDSICVGDTTTLIASGGLTYFWSTFTNTASISVGPLVNTTYTVTATDGNGCEASASTTVVVNALPATPVITQSGNLLSTTGGFASYQWFFNGNPISGATSASHTATQDGNYTVTVTNAAGCAATSAPLAVIVIGITPSGFANFGLQVYPNPNGGKFTVRLDLERDRNVSLRIFDLVGKQVWSQQGDLPFGEWKQAIDLSQLTKGTYMLDVTSEGQRMTTKVVVQ